MAKDTVYVIGHKSPDTDTVCSAIAYAEYLKKNKVNAVAAVCGELNPETKFVLKYFKVNGPKKLASAAGLNLTLVDHNEKTQMPEGAESAKIVEVLDHHKVAFEWNEPIKFHAEPPGSSRRRALRPTTSCRSRFPTISRRAPSASIRAPSTSARQ